ncbi:MAG: AbrB/MazE/SpoVT family DNA-binding domain-containing protein [Actinobacteria bacterium]|nr:AbrB/MazE/SpoVT family DNA-binding domain-containing protein [Actinomycetota bacterium]
MDQINKKCCMVESVITVDERGQMILPKNIRDKANIKAGDKFAVALLEKDGNVCCLSLVKVENLSGAVMDLMNPVNE